MNWKNLDATESFELLKAHDRVDLSTAMAGESGAKRVAEYRIPMGCGLVYSYAAKQVDDEILDILQALADEQQLTQICGQTYNGGMVVT